MTIKIHELLTFAVDHEASDIHLGAGEVPSMRIHGEVRRLELPVLTADETRRLAYSVMNEKQKAAFENDLEIDFSIGMRGLARFRVNVFHQARGLGLVLRQIAGRVLTLDELKAPKVFHAIAGFKKGLVLVTGPTGSGKSTTLAAIIDKINKERHEHILTIEDPIEYVHVPDKCIISQREVGTHTRSFAAALRSALREDPDVILVGELRDLETVSLALTAAETGHLVFGTMHTNSAPETIDRIVDSYPHEQQAQVRTMLASSLMAVVTQMLVRTRSNKGRVAVHEIMLVNSAIRNLIRENKLYQIPSTLQAARSQGMQTMEDGLRDLVGRKVITREQAIGYANNAKLFDGDESSAPRRSPTIPTTPRRR